MCVTVCGGSEVSKDRDCKGLGLITTIDNGLMGFLFSMCRLGESRLLLCNSRPNHKNLVVARIGSLSGLDRV